MGGIEERGEGWEVYRKGEGREDVMLDEMQGLWE